MATTETFRATAGISALNSGSGLYKLVKMGSNASNYAQSDVEVAHMEAQFTGPDLLDSAKELLQISENEEAERKALLDSMQAYDEILTRIETKASVKSDGGLSDAHTQSTHGLDFDSAQDASAGFDVLDSAAGRSIQPMIHSHGAPPPQSRPNAHTFETTIFRVRATAQRQSGSIFLPRRVAVARLPPLPRRARR